MEGTTNVGVALSKPKRRKKRTRMARGARREQLLAAANTIVASEGIRGLTMERLSEVARISKPVVYSHFENSSELLVALLQNYWDEVDRRVPNAPRAGQSFEDHLSESVHAHLGVVLNREGAVRHVLHTVIEDPLIEQLRTQREQQVVERWAQKTSAYYSISPEQSELIAVVYRGALEAAASYVSRFPVKRSDVEKMVVRMGMATLRATHREQTKVDAEEGAGKIPEPGSGKKRSSHRGSNRVRGRKSVSKPG